MQEETRKSPSALDARGLSVILGGRKVLEVPSFQVLPNEVMVLIGPNGSGKTTLLLCLALLLKPGEGTISYRGSPVLGRDHVLRLRRRLAVVFQEPLLLNSSVWDNVILGLRLRGVPGDEARARAQRWMERFGITSLAKRQARLLSSGEGKRVNLARAFALEPEVLFLDEPFNALDSPTRQSLLGDFESVLRETKVTTVMVTHDRNEALMLAHRVAVIMNGALQQVGSSQEIFGHPRTTEIAEFVGMENLLDGTVVACEGELSVIDINGTLVEAVADCNIGQKVSVGMRPENITVALSRLSSSARNCLAGTVKVMIASGPFCRVEIDCGFPLVVLVTSRSAQEMGLENGTQVYATFKAVSIQVIKRN